MNGRLPKQMRSVVFLSGATMIGQAVAFLLLPFITRIYSPDVYGGYLVLISLATVLGNVVNLRLERAVPILESDAEARILGRACIWISGSICLTAYFIFTLLEEKLCIPLGLCSADWGGMTVSVGALLIGGYLLAVQVSTRFEVYGVIALRNIMMPCVTVFVQLGFGLFYPSFEGLLIGFALGRLTAVVIGRGLWKEESNGVAFKEYLDVVLRFKRFLYVGTPAALLNVLGLQLPVVVFSNLYTPYVAGQVGLAITVTMFPVIAVSAAIGQVLVGKVGARIRNGEAGLFAIFLRWSAPIAGISIFFGILVWLLSPWLVSFLGEEWRGITPFMKTMAILTVFRMFGSSIAPVLGVLESHGLQIMADASRVLAIVMVWVLAKSESWSVNESLFWMTAMISLTYLLSWAFAGFSMWKRSRIMAAPVVLKANH